VRRIGTAFLGAMLAGSLPCPAEAADNETLSARWTLDRLRPTVSSADGRFSLSLRARLQLDAGGFDQPSNVEDVTGLRDVEFKHLNSGALVRRAYLGVEGSAFRDFWYEYRMNFGGDGFRIAAPYIHLARVSYNIGSYENGPLLRINAGLIKPVFTYNDATSSASLTFLERAAAVNVATETFGGGAPRLGAELTFQQTDLFRRGDNLVVSGAFTGHVASKRSSEISSDANSNGTHLLGRIVYRLWSDGVSNIQIGGDASRILSVGDTPGPGGARTLSLQDEPEIQVDGNALVDTGPLPAQGGGLWGIEAAGNLRNVNLAAEYYEFAIERDTTCGDCVVADDPRFSGWYIEGSWMLTGETKTYQPNALNNGMATFANPHVSAPFTLGGGLGAWEIAARYSDLDLDWRRGTLGSSCPVVGCVRGGQQKIFAIGLNWYLTDNFRFLVDYMFVHVDKLSGTGAQIGQNVRVFGTRFQFTN
jgi:phosphate-selective porin OprO/OprP